MANYHRGRAGKIAEQKPDQEGRATAFDHDPHLIAMADVTHFVSDDASKFVGTLGFLHGPKRSSTVCRRLVTPSK